MKHICQHRFTEEGKIIYHECHVTAEMLTKAWNRLVPGIGEEHGFFRCGWCGQPADPKGSVLERDLIPDGLVEDWDNARMVNGECCPYGNEEVWPEDRVF